MPELSRLTKEGFNYKVHCQEILDYVENPMLHKTAVRGLPSVLQALRIGREKESKESTREVDVT